MSEQTLQDIAYPLREIITLSQTQHGRLDRQSVRFHAEKLLFHGHHNRWAVLDLNLRPAD